MKSNKQMSYFILHKEEIMAAFGEINKGVKQYLPSICNQAKADLICKDAQLELDKLIPHLPDIGESNNELNEGMIMVAISISYYKVFVRQKLSVELLGKMLYDLRAFQFSEMTEEEKNAITDETFSSKRLNEQRLWTKWSLKCIYPYNWAAQFVEGDGKEFDYGTDYVECGVVKVCHKFGADKVIPFICLMDLLESNVLGLGLQRTKTLADGDNICDFRFKRGRPTNRTWDTEIEKIRKLINNPSYTPILKGHL
ncbi:MAG: L-2-amino-thiazoline-4-carboxylic acid hydrolase [Bacteroidota bacterium]